MTKEREFWSYSKAMVEWDKAIQSTDQEELNSTVLAMVFKMMAALNATTANTILATGEAVS